MSKSKTIQSLIIAALMIVPSVVAINAQESNQPERIPTNPAALANVYRVDDGFQIWRWNPETEQGYFTLNISYDEVDAAIEEAELTNENVMVAESGDISFWVLTDGTLLVKSPMVDGAAYEFNF